MATKELEDQLKEQLTVLADRERTLGTDHQDTATSYNNIGVTYESMGDYSKAQEYHQKTAIARGEQ
jgi:preprotein translocase subunit SecA/nephrocystin-3